LRTVIGPQTGENMSTIAKGIIRLRLPSVVLGTMAQFSLDNFSNSVGQFAKFRGSPRQVYHILVINFLWLLNPTKYAVFVAGNR